jgi:hypothetical protein
MAIVQVGNVVWEDPARHLGFQDWSYTRIGAVDTSGVLSVPAEYTNMGWFENGVAWAVREDGIFVLINAGGQEYFSLPPGAGLSTTMSTDEGLYLVIFQECPITGDTLRSVMDMMGTVLLPPSRFDWIDGYDDGVMRIWHEGQFGFIDMAGNVLIAPEYDFAYPFTYGRGIVGNEIGVGIWRYGIIDARGDEVTRLEYHNLFQFRGGLARFNRMQGGYGFVNTLGEEIMPATFFSARCFSEGLAAVAQQGDPVPGRSWEYQMLWGFIDGTGRLVADYQFIEVRDFNEGMAAVAWHDDDGNLIWGYITTTGEMVIPPQFASAGFFNEGFAVVNMGAEVYHPRYGDPLWGTGMQLIGGTNMLIDRWGRVMLDLSGYDRIAQVSEGMLAVNKGWRFSEGPRARYFLGMGLWGFLQLVY